MISMKEYRILILEEEGIFKKYQKKVGYMHQDCLDDYAAKKHLLNASID